MEKSQIPQITAREALILGKKYDYLRLHIRTVAGRTMTREVVRHPGAVVIVPVLADGRIVLIRNYRVALAAWLVECCAGTIERQRAADGAFGQGEDPAACAGRELLEETGYQAGKIQHLGTFFTTPGLTDESMHAYLATDLTHLGQRLEEDERIEVILVTAKEALAMIDRGELKDSKSMSALFLAQRQGFLSA